MVSFRHSVTDGMSVSKGAPILNISAENMPEDVYKRQLIHKYLNLQVLMQFIDIRIIRLTMMLLLVFGILLFKSIHGIARC